LQPNPACARAIDASEWRVARARGFVQRLEIEALLEE
jgi:hypothetical protein